MTTLAISLTWLLFALAGLLGLAGWFVYLWAVQTGQFRDVEEAAEKMLEDDVADHPAG